MTNYNDAPLEIHVHGQIFLRKEVSFAEAQEAVRPLWHYAGARSFSQGAVSAYEEEPGMQFDAGEHVLRLCWTVRGSEDFRQSLDEVCMGLNELADRGCVLEVTFYDREFDEMDEEEDDTPIHEGDSRDDFFLLFIGPTPAAIMQIQRDLLVQDLINMMERHFDATELQGVVNEVDKLFTQRFDDLVSSLELGRPPRGGGGAPGAGGHGGGRRPRHLH